MKAILIAALFVIAILPTLLTVLWIRKRQSRQEFSLLLSFGVLTGIIVDLTEGIDDLGDHWNDAHKREELFASLRAYAQTLRISHPQIFSASPFETETSPAQEVAEP